MLVNFYWILYTCLRPNNETRFHYVGCVRTSVAVNLKSGLLRIISLFNYCPFRPSFGHTFVGYFISRHPYLYLLPMFLHSFAFFCIVTCIRWLSPENLWTTWLSHFATTPSVTPVLARSVVTYETILVLLSFVWRSRRFFLLACSCPLTVSVHRTVFISSSSV